MYCNTGSIEGKGEIDDLSLTRRHNSAENFVEKQKDEDKSLWKEYMSLV
jgi:hypothetical protein